MQQKDNHYYGLAIGFSVISSAAAIGAISGCCLNPAVPFGTNFVSAIFKEGMGKWTSFLLE
jgi:glycerol uptake facilitator-like aquaporin